MQIITLKEEINKCATDILGLAKWKLTIVAAIALAALGWEDFKPSPEASSFMLCSVGVVCAYADWFIYKKYITQLAIARFIRNYRPAEQNVLSMYEQYMTETRGKNLFFFSERWPHFYSSMFISIGLPLLSYLNSPCSFSRKYIILSAVGVAVICALMFVASKNRRKLMERKDPPNHISEIFTALRNILSKILSRFHTEAEND